MPPFPPQPPLAPSPDPDVVAALKEEQTDGVHRSRAWGTFPECTPMWADFDDCDFEVATWCAQFRASQGKHLVREGGTSCFPIDRPGQQNVQRDQTKHMRVSSAVSSACENEQSSASGQASGRLESIGNTVAVVVSPPACVPAELGEPMVGSLEMHDPFF